MKRHRILIYALLTCIVLYLDGAFVAATLDITKWSIILRGFIGIFILSVAIVATAIQLGKEEDNHT